MRRWVNGIWVALAAAGCSAAELPSEFGELGNGVFSWVCTSEADPACSEDDLFAPFPETVALGGGFDLQYETTNGRNLPPESGSVLIDESSLGFQAAQTGIASLVVYRGDELLDFIYLTVEPVDRLDLRSSAATIEVGGRAQLRVEAICPSGSCAGTLPFAWAVDDPSVIARVGDGNDAPHERLYEGAEVGATQVRVSDGNVEASVLIEVTEAGGGA